jgi:rhamnose transport system substrate-binding protein
MKKNTVSIVIVVAILSMLLAACGNTATTTTAAGGDAKKPVYAFISKTTADPMFTTYFKGFTEACNELNVDCIYKGTDNASAEKQIEIINQMIAQNVAGLVVIAADFDGLTPVLQEAMAKGIPVVTMDSSANPKARNVHVEFVELKSLAIMMMQAAYDMAGGKGQVGILSGDPRISYFSDMEKYILEEYNSDPVKYKDIVMLPVAYGYDLPDQSTAEGQAMLKNYPDVKVIINPSSVGILAVGKLIQDQNLNVKITGAGLPSEMAVFVKDGICPEFFLWDPINMGYLTAYTLDSIVKKQITGAAGDKFEAGRMGPYEVTIHPDGGTQVLLGPPTKFDINNIDQYSPLF